MKILLFNLGTIEDRIIDWGKEGFKTLFEHDIILWGPISDAKFVYEGKDIPIISFFEPTTIEDVFKKLPVDWYPDVITCDTSVLNYIPDISKCPVKTILFTRDSWSDTIFNKRLVEMFDFVNHATIDRTLYSAMKVNLLPLSNYAVSIPPPGIVNSEFEKREIDVIAIANYDNAFYHERYKILYKLAESNKSDLKIEFFKGIKRPEIYSYYQRSKIVIDWAHTLSNRSYEAALNGCLLFSHKDNPLIKDFWIPWVEYIPYDESNMMELISYYLRNPELAKKVIASAHEKILKLPASWGEYVWKNINIAYDAGIPVQDRVKYNENTPADVKHSYSATPLIYNYDYKTNFPTNWKELYFSRIDSAISAAGSGNVISYLVEASRVAFLLKNSELCLKYLDELQNVLPAYGWIYYLRARIQFDQKDFEKALNSLDEAINCGLNSPQLLCEFVLPVIEKGNVCDGRRVINYMWQPVYQYNNDYQVKAMLHLVYELCGEIYRLQGEMVSAADAYSKAITYLPVPDCIYKLSPLLIKSQKFETLRQIAYALIQLRQRRNALRILKEHKRSLKSFVGIRKLKILRNLINLILILLLLGKHLSSKIIIELIAVLNKKAGLNYLV
jgi:tetratricopeptide (TPR) repeat protein